MPRASQPGHTAHDTPAHGLTRSLAATARCSSSTVARLCDLRAERYDDFETLAASSMKVPKRSGYSMGSSACASHGKNRFVSFGQQQRTRPRECELCTLIRSRQPWRTRYVIREYFGCL